MAGPSGEVTFCFTDIEGSSALVSDLGTERYERVLGEHRVLLRAAFKQTRGVEINTEGDGMFYVWSHAPDALAGCAAAQRALLEHEWPYGVSVRVRMGLHTGNAVATADGDYVGLAIHQAARVSAAANGGQILVSPDSATVIGERLPSGCALEPLGQFHVRDFSGPVGLSRLIGSGLPQVDTLPRLARAEPRNFAALPTSFIGREPEIEALRALVAQHRLVTVVGAGGVGKTRLAREVARLSTSGSPDGVWLVELESVDPPTEGGVANAIAATVGIALPPDQSAVDAVVADLVQHSRLLVLDACENVVDATAAFVERVTAHRGNSRFIATTREALSVRAEQRWPLTPLVIPEGSGHDAAQVAANPAGRLFADRARAVSPSFTIDETTADDVALVCRTLEGIPLALELAAARLAEVDLSELASSVQRVLELRGGYRTDAAHHRTTRALVAWSADALTPTQRAVYMRLAPLRGWSTRRAVVVAATASGSTAVTVEDANVALDALIAKSILTKNDDGRVRMLDLVREHAAEELAASGEEPLVNETLLDWAISRRHAELRNPRQRAGGEGYAARAAPLQPNDLSYDTMRALLLWSYEADPLAMARLVATMQVEFQLGGRWVDGLEWVDAALLEIGPEHVALRAALLHLGAAINQVQGETKAATALAHNALAAAEAAIEAKRLGQSTGAITAVDPVTCLVGAVNVLGASLLQERRLDEAEAMFSRAESAAAPGSRALLVLRNNLASVRLARGDFDGAEAALREAAEIAEQSSDPNGPQVRLNIAALRGIAGDHAGAAAEFEACIAAAEALGVVQVLAMAEVNLGIARRNLGDPRALETLRHGVRRAREQQDLLAMAEGMKAMADVARSDPTDLAVVAEDLGAVASRIPNDATAAWAAALGAVAAAAAGDFEGAKAARRSAVERAKSGVLPPGDASLVLLDLANSLADSDPDTAALLLGSADATTPSGLPVQPSFERVHESILRRLRSALGNRADVLIADGAKLDVDSALELVIL